MAPEGGIFDAFWGHSGLDKQFGLGSEMQCITDVEGRKNSDNFLQPLGRVASRPGISLYRPSTYSISYLSFNIKYLAILTVTAVLANLTTF